MKKLQIDCGTCDVTNLREEALEGYGAVEINCGTLFVTGAAQTILLRRGVELDSGSVVTVPDGAALMSRTGAFTLTAADVQTRPAVLTVTGSLTLEPGAGPAADSFEAVHVTGSLVCARSDRSPKIEVVGLETVYPDGYLYVDGGLVLDRVFRLRFGGKKVYARGTVTVGDPRELEALAEAGTRVLCGKLAAPEGLLEAALKVAEPERPQNLAVYPDGWAYLEGRCRLTERELRRGKRLWIDGSLCLDRRDAGTLSKLEGLHVTGRAVVPEECRELLEELDPDCGDIFAYRGKLLQGKDIAAVDRPLLEREGAVTCLDCSLVTLEESLTPEEIERGLVIRDCSVVDCAPEQEDAVRAVSEEVDLIRSGVLSLAQPDDPDTVVINAGTYKF